MIVEVLPYHPHWTQKYVKEKELLKISLGNIIHKIHHIGSTSVKGLASKPIIDIIIEVRDLDDLDKSKEKFENLAYEVMGEFGIAGRRYFRKGTNIRTHQIHAFETNDAHIFRHLVFRDYLIAHPKILEEYGQLKLVLAKTCNNDIGLYCAGKDSFIKFHEQQALAWSSRSL